jgi:hypothetical protein
MYWRFHPSPAQISYYAQLRPKHCQCNSKVFNLQDACANKATMFKVLSCRGRGMHGDPYPHVTRHHLVPTVQLRRDCGQTTEATVSSWTLAPQYVTCSLGVTTDHIVMSAMTTCRCDLLFVCFAGYGYNAKAEKQVLNSVVAMAQLTTDSLALIQRECGRVDASYTSGDNVYHMEAVSTAYAACSCLHSIDGSFCKHQLLALRQLYVASAHSVQQDLRFRAICVRTLGTDFGRSGGCSSTDISVLIAQLSCDFSDSPLQAVQPVLALSQQPLLGCMRSYPSHPPRRALPLWRALRRQPSPQAKHLLPALQHRSGASTRSTQSSSTLPLTTTCAADWVLSSRI